MAVYRPKYKGGKRYSVYHYDFIVNGIRYKGSTGETSKINARDKESEKRREARAGIQRQEIQTRRVSAVSGITTLDTPGRRIWRWTGYR